MPIQDIFMKLVFGSESVTCYVSRCFQKSTMPKIKVLPTSLDHALRILVLVHCSILVIKKYSYLSSWWAVVALSF